MNNDNIAGFFLGGWYVFDNFAPFQIVWRGKLYPTAEHAYQAAHFINRNPDLAEQVRHTLSPREASDLANLNSDKDDPAWKDKRLAVMEELVRCKIEQHAYVRQVLVETGHREIVEMNDDDAFWGWGEDHKGENNLGQIWMKLRSEIVAA